jgi:HEAT repeat protein
MCSASRATGPLPLIAALADEAWPVRAQAARALGRLREPAAVAPLADRLTDRSWWVRRHAAYAMRRLGPTGRAALRRLMEHSSDPYARDMAREALEDRSRLRA